MEVLNGPKNVVMIKQLYKETQLQTLVLTFKVLNEADQAEQIHRVKQSPSLLRTIHNPTPAVIDAALEAISDIHGRSLTKDEREYLIHMLVHSPRQPIDLHSPHAHLLMMPSNNDDHALVHIDLEPDWWASTADDMAGIERHVNDIRSLVDRYREDNLPQHFVNFLGNVSDQITGGNLGGFSNDASVENTDGDSFFVTRKRSDGVFDSTDFARVLEDQSVEVLVMTGLNEEACFAMSAAGAFNLGYQVITSPDVAFNTRNPSNETEIIHHAYSNYVWMVENTQQLQQILDQRSRFIP